MRARPTVGSCAPVGFFLLLGRSVPAGRRQTPPERAAGSRLPPRRPCLIRPARLRRLPQSRGRRRWALAGQPARPAAHGSASCRLPCQRMDLRRLRAGDGRGGVRGGAARRRCSCPGTGRTALTAWEALGGDRRPAGARGRLAASCWRSSPRPSGWPRSRSRSSALVTLAGSSGWCSCCSGCSTSPTAPSGREWALWLAWPAPPASPVGCPLMRDDGSTGGRATDRRVQPASRA